jgi:hypothetical protein
MLGDGHIDQQVSLYGLVIVPGRPVSFPVNLVNAPGNEFPIIRMNDIENRFTE